MGLDRWRGRAFARCRGQPGPNLKAAPVRRPLIAGGPAILDAWGACATRPRQVNKRGAASHSARRHPPMRLRFSAPHKRSAKRRCRKVWVLRGWMRDVSTLGVSVGNTVGLDFHQPLAVDQAPYLHECTGRPDTGKDLSVCPRRFFPARNIGEHHASTNDALKPESRVTNRLGNDLQAPLRLTIDIARGRGSAIGSDGRRA